MKFLDIVSAHILAPGGDRPLVCRDGASLAVAGGKHAYCSPQSPVPPLSGWELVTLYPSGLCGMDEDDLDLLGVFDTDETMVSTDDLAAVIDKHGGYAGPMPDDQWQAYRGEAKWTGWS